MQEKLYSIKNDAISLILSAQDKNELEEIRIQFLGRNGSLTLAMKEIAKLPQAEKPEAGKTINEIKNIIENTFQEKLSTIHNLPAGRQVTNQATLDVTEPGIRPPLGHLHLVTQAIEEITTIFERIGFSRVRYPEVEWDYYAFTALNFPENHPARDDWETFFTTEKNHADKNAIRVVRIITPSNQFDNPPPSHTAAPTPTKTIKQKWNARPNRMFFKIATAALR